MGLGVCVTRLGFGFANGVAKEGARIYLPLFSPISCSSCIRQTSSEPTPCASLNAHLGEKLEMLRAFNNYNSCNTADSFNNNENFLNNNKNCFNTYHTTTVNNTTVDDRSEILAWLSPLEPQVRHRDIASRRVGSIGAWVLETEEFKCWYKGSKEDGSYRPTLFCDGNPGVGKSYIA